MNLEELRKQRERIAQHLQWLDKQISDLETTAKSRQLPPESTPPAKNDVPSIPTDPIREVASEVDIVELPDQSDLKQLHEITKAGCLLWIAIISAILILIGFIIYKSFPEWDEEDYRKFHQNYQSQSPLE